MATLTGVQKQYILHWGEMGTRWGINRNIKRQIQSRTPLPTKKPARVEGTPNSTATYGNEAGAEAPPQQDADLYCRSNTRMFGSLSPTMSRVTVKLLRSGESSICCV